MVNAEITVHELGERRRSTALIDKKEQANETKKTTVVVCCVQLPVFPDYVRISVSDTLIYSCLCDIIKWSKYIDIDKMFCLMIDPNGASIEKSQIFLLWRKKHILLEPGK